LSTAWAKTRKRNAILMEPITAIVTALALGVAAGLKPAAEQAIKDSYAALKALITRKYAQVPLDQLEANPNSKNRRGVVEEDLAAAQANHDPEVLQHAQALLKAIQRQEPHTAAAIGVDLKDNELPRSLLRGIKPPKPENLRTRLTGRFGDAAVDTSGLALAF
jgi:hypothetical protein